MRGFSVGVVDAINIGRQELTGKILISILKGMQVPDELRFAIVGGEVSAETYSQNAIYIPSSYQPGTDVFSSTQ